MARPKSFDPDDALDRAVEVFWARGFADTSVDDLVKATGVGRQSLYDTFGDKQAIYLAALDRYRRVSGKRLEDAACSPGSPAAVLADLFRMLAENVGLGARPGCLLVNASLEVGACAAAGALVEQNTRALEDTFEALLERAERVGEIEAGGDRRARARVLVNAIHGLRLTARPTGDTKMVRDVVAETLRAVGVRRAP